MANCQVLIRGIDEGYNTLKTPIRKCYFLHKILESRSPSSILELGSGTTTLLFADYTKRNPKATVETCEHNPKWHEAVDKLLDTDRIRYNLISMVDLGESTEYETQYSGNYDFIYIDGPPTAKKYNTDFVKVLDQSTLKTIVVDERFSTAQKVVEELINRNIQHQVFWSENFPKDILAKIKPSEFSSQKPHLDDRHTVIYLENI